MHHTAELLEAQASRISRAKRFARAADRFQDAGERHAVARCLFTPALTNPEVAERLLERNRAHSNRAFRRWSQARKLRDLAGRILQGIA